MKTRVYHFQVTFALLALTICNQHFSVAIAQGTAFTYSGQLVNNGAPVTGSYDFQFAIYDAVTAGNLKAGPTVVSAIGVTNGLFQVILDYGQGIFTGADRWLDIGVRPSGASNFTPLGPRQKFTASPYAIYSGQAANANAVATSSVGVPQLATSGSPGPGQILGYNGSVLNWVDPTTIGWSLFGNGGTTPGVNFLGTTDDEPLELWSWNHRTLHLEYVRNNTGTITVSVNVVGGYEANTVSNGVFGATIAGGGYYNSISGYKANLIGGSGSWGTISGGANNTLIGQYGTIGGGTGNTVSAADATIPGGINNSATGLGSFAAGQGAHATNPGSFVWGDGSGSIYSSAAAAWDVLATGGVNFHTGNSGANIYAGTNVLTLYGAWLVANGNGGEQAYLGGDGSGNDVQIGSLNPSVQNIAAYNATTGQFMNLTVKTLSIIGGGDLAEPFELSSSQIPKGAVVIIDDQNPGQLRMSQDAYDTRVAGVVSGANGIFPGIMMHQQALMKGNENVSLTGRVYVLADASNGAIKPGDLLTTSNTPGHAMKVTDHARAQGAILGKAMSSLQDGKGMVLMLVTLQ